MGRAGGLAAEPADPAFLAVVRARRRRPQVPPKRRSTLVEPPGVGHPARLADRFRERTTAAVVRSVTASSRLSAEPRSRAWKIQSSGSYSSAGLGRYHSNPRAGSAVITNRTPEACNALMAT